VMRDHKISLFKTREDDLNAELAEKDAQLQDLEVSVWLLQALTEGCSGRSQHVAGSSASSRREIVTSRGELDAKGAG